VRPVSKKRAAQAGARAECRKTVLERDRHCRGHGLTDVPCRRVPSEVHELGRGAYRQSCWLEPELCIGLCRPCHQWVTEHPTAAQALGLALPGWQIDQILNARRQ